MPKFRTLAKQAAFLALIAMLVIPFSAAWAANPPQPTYGTADVNGSDSEWVSSDFFAYTYWLNDNTRLKAEIYLRYDCAAQILYIRVRGYSNIYYIDGDTGSDQDTQVWLDGSGTPSVTVFTGDNGTPPDFAWYGPHTGSNYDGFEGSVSLAPGNHTIKVQTVSYVIASGVEDLVSQTKTSNGSFGFIPLEISCVEYDYGDLPSPYDDATHGYVTLPTGGRHQIGNLYLGVSIDAESDGQVNSNALGDDNGGSDDEDGVQPTPGVVWSVAGGGSVDVWVTGGNGCLYAWVDWNQSGGMGGTGELTINNVFVTPGLNTITFSIPGGTPLTGNYFARFRLYPTNEAGNCSGVSGSLTGTATNGEVEDYVFDPSIPTAVDITSLTARGAANPLPLALAAGGLLVLVGMAVAFRRMQ